jgi:16S rRNA (guanine966-N2)-methyltransferase
LDPVIEESRVLDLFAGCGSLGIEALSRGAAFCCFLESAPPALEALEDNLSRSHLADKAEVIRHDALTAIPLLEARPPSNVVLIDPPYDLLRRSPRRFAAFLEDLARGQALAPGAVVVVQHDVSALLPSAIGPLRTTDARRYGTTALTFLSAPLSLSPGERAG